MQTPKRDSRLALARLLVTAACAIVWLALGLGVRVSTARAQACLDGRVRVSGHCCWPGQRWSASARACDGAPQCPEGLAEEGETCVPRVAAAAPPPIAAPSPPPIPPPAPTTHFESDTAGPPLAVRSYDESRPRRDRWVTLCATPCDAALTPGTVLGIGHVDGGTTRLAESIAPGTPRVRLALEDRSGLRAGGIALIVAGGVVGAGLVVAGSLLFAVDGSTRTGNVGGAVGVITTGGIILVASVVIGALLVTMGDIARVVGSGPTASRSRPWVLPYASTDGGGLVGGLRF